MKNALDHLTDNPVDSRVDNPVDSTRKTLKIVVSKRRETKD